MGRLLLFMQASFYASRRPPRTEGRGGRQRKYDFVPVRNNPNRLVMKVATARDAFGIAGR